MNSSQYFQKITITEEFITDVGLDFIFHYLQTEFESVYQKGRVKFYFYTFDDEDVNQNQRSLYFYNYIPKILYAVVP